MFLGQRNPSVRLRLVLKSWPLTHLATSRRIWLTTDVFDASMISGYWFREDWQRGSRIPNHTIPWKIQRGKSYWEGTGSFIFGVYYFTSWHENCLHCCVFDCCGDSYCHHWERRTVGCWYSGPFWFGCNHFNLRCWEQRTTYVCWQGRLEVDFYTNPCFIGLNFLRHNCLSLFIRFFFFFEYPFLFIFQTTVTRFILLQPF